MATTISRNALTTRLAIFQTLLEIKRHYTIARLIPVILGPLVILALLRMGLVDWAGGFAGFRWIVCAFLATGLALSSLITLATAIISDQEDGTLLRAMTLPAGFQAHLLAKVAFVTITSLVTYTLMILAAVVGAGGDVIVLSPKLLLLIPFIVLLVVVLAPLGLIAGGLSRKLTDVFYVMLVAYVLVAISDLVVPPGLMPDWITKISYVFPFYWLGHLCRMILLDDSMGIATPSGELWVFGVGVLVAWTVAGLILTPKVMAKLARRQSPSRLEKSTYVASV